MSLQALKYALSKHGLLGSSIIPNRSFDPSVFVHVAYPKKDGGEFDVEPGTTLSMTETQKQPAVSFSFEACEKGGKDRFTLAMLDPDARGKDEAKPAPFRHWLVADLKPHDPTKVEHAKVFTHYMGPAPPAGTGPHRYTFLLYRQPHHSSPEFFGDKDHRRKYDIQRFVDENKLTLVGANFFLAENKSSKE